MVKSPRYDSGTIADMLGEMRSDFRAGQDSKFMARLSGTAAAGSGADYHYRFEHQYLHMIERSRHYERNDPVVGQGISRLAANVVQDGFTPDPCTRDPELDALLKAKWSSWANNPDACHSEGEHTFHDMEEIVFRSAIRDGDMFILPLQEGSLQLIEGHRPRTPRNTKRNVVHGLLLDDMAKRQELWIAPEILGVNGRLDRVSDVARIPFRDKLGVRQVFQVYFPKRSSQRRGYPAVAPVSDTIGQADDLFFTTLVKSQMNSLVVLLEEQAAAGGTAGFDNSPTPLSTDPTTVEPIGGINAGLHVKVAAGRTIKGHAPQVPNQEFFSHANLLLTFVAINLDMPVAMLLLDPSNTNFSGWRGAMDQARVRFRWLQGKMKSRFHRPTYEFKVRQWLATDPEIRSRAAKSNVDAFAHKWKVPGWPYIEPFKDSQSDDLQQTRFLNSPRRVQSARGRDWDEIGTEIVDDKASLIEKAIVKADELNAKYASANVDWRADILGPGLTSLATPLSPGQPEPEPTK